MLFSLIDDCKSLFHGFCCKKIIHLGKQTRVLMVLPNGSWLKCWQTLLYLFLVVLIWICLGSHFLLSHLFYVFLEISFYFLYDYWNETNKDSTKEIVAPNCWLQLEASFMQVIIDWTKDFHLAMALSTYKFDMYTIGLFQTSFWNSVTFFHKTHRVNLIRYL